MTGAMYTRVLHLAAGKMKKGLGETRGLGEALRNLDGAAIRGDDLKRHIKRYATAEEDAHR